MKKIIAVLLLVLVIGCQKESLFNDSISKPFNPINSNGSLDVTILRVVANDGITRMYISILDSNGVAISDVDESNIEVLVENKWVNTYVFNNDTSNITTRIRAALLMDYSGSMYEDTSDIPAMETAIKSFIYSKSNYDELEIIKFDKKVVVVQKFTSNITDLLNAVDDNSWEFGKTTALYDACLTGILDAVLPKGDTTLPAVIVFTDGNNNYYPFDPNTVINSAVDNQIPVYTIGYGHSEFESPDTTELRHIADVTGGRYYWCPSSDSITQLYKSVRTQLKKAVVITFPISRENTEQIISVTVKYRGFRSFVQRIQVFCTEGNFLLTNS